MTNAMGVVSLRRIVFIFPLLRLIETPAGSRRGAVGVEHLPHRPSPGFNQPVGAPLAPKDQEAYHWHTLDSRRLGASGYCHRSTGKRARNGPRAVLGSQRVRLRLHHEISLDALLRSWPL